MRDKGYCGIGIEHAKTEYNYWTLFRTAQILDVDFLFIIGARFKPGTPDVRHSYLNMPVYSYVDFNDFNAHRPYSCKLIGVELADSAIDIADYRHPSNAIYLLGAEDHGLTARAMAACQDIVRLYGDYSLNVSVAGSIVLYDRNQKSIAAAKEAQ